MFGRASDVTHVRKQNVSVDAGNVFFVRFIRMKTSEEQGLFLYQDLDYATCPLLAIAVALATQATPSADLVGNLPTQSAPTQVALGDEPPLLELLDAPGCTVPALAPDAHVAATPLAIHSHVNRLLNRLLVPAGVDEQLTSHSFRRGGAQHANSSTELTDRWIFDRGAWNISSTNKAFNYVFNTRAEGHKVAKALSGWRPGDDVPLRDLCSFGSGTREQIMAVQACLFSTCWRLETARFCASSRVLDVLTAHVLLHFPRMKEAHQNSPFVAQLEWSALDAQCSIADLLSWSAHLAASPTRKQQHCEDTGEEIKQEMEEQRVIRHQAAVIGHLTSLAKRQDERLDALEALANDGARAAAKRSIQQSSASEQPSKRQRPSATTLSATWYDWYCREPRLWSATGERQRKSDAKLLAAYMKLFLDELKLDDTAHTYRDGVMAHGQKAERGLLAFLSERGISSRGSLSVVKHVRKLHKTGALNELIAEHKRRLNAGAFTDPAPRHTHDILDQSSS